MVISKHRINSALPKRLLEKINEVFWKILFSNKESQDSILRSTICGGMIKKSKRRIIMKKLLNNIEYTIEQLGRRKW